MPPASDRIFIKSSSLSVSLAHRGIIYGLMMLRWRWPCWGNFRPYWERERRGKRERRRKRERGSWQTEYIRCCCRHTPHSSSRHPKIITGSSITNINKHFLHLQLQHNDFFLRDMSHYCRHASLPVGLWVNFGGLNRFGNQKPQAMVFWDSRKFISI